jgi:hypothetical protein
MYSWRGDGGLFKGKIFGKVILILSQRLSQEGAYANSFSRI